MLKKYEIPTLIALIFILLLVLRFLFYLTFKEDIVLGKEISLEHILLESPKKNSFQQYFFIDNILVVLPLFPEYNYGDSLILKGVVESYYDKNDDHENLILKNPEVEIVENIAVGWIKIFRYKFLTAYNSVLPPREAGLISGIVLGVEDGIDSKFKSELIRSGMLHVVVASGSNIVLVSGVFFSIVIGLFKKWLAITLAIICIFLYALLTGFEPPIVRASIMTSFAFVAMLLGRQRVAFITLLFSGWMILMVSPKLISDVGFQLSFSATLGIILFQTVLISVLKTLPTLLKEDFSTTISAQIGALPFLLFTFGEVNLLSVIVNIILLWTIPIIMIFGLFGAVLGLVSSYLSQPFILLTYPLLVFFSEVVRVASNFYIPLEKDSVFFPIIVIYYVLIIYMLAKLKIKK